MIRKAFMIQVKQGMAGEYKRRHNPVWTELQEVLKDHSVGNYSIFLSEDTGFLFGYLEVADEDVFCRIGESEVCRRWWKYMKEVLITEDEESPMAKEEELKEVFHLD